MASLISDSEKGNLVNIFQDIFDTFKREVIVYKEPVQIVQQINLENIFGYGPASNQTNYEYTPVFKKINAVVRYSKNHQFNDIEEGSILYPTGDLSIKVEKAGRDYIKEGKTEKIVIDNKTFNLDGQEVIQRFLNSEYYIFNLKLTS
jgi:hypothetical protein